MISDDVSATPRPPRTTYFGRVREREHVAALLRSAPLVTVTGPGGMGKTRLALEVTAALDTPARWCLLASVPDAAAVPSAVAAAVGRDSAPSGAVAVIGEALRADGALLVLDNCEHVVGAVANLADALLAARPDARILATSREPLGVEGEHVVALDGLALPGDERPETVRGADAVALFVDRARRIRWDFALDDANAAAIARICRRLDGLPLALELAAARMQSLTPADVADRLDQRFALLARPRTRGAERHRTLRAAVDWSYRLLEPAERLVFERLAAFAAAGDLDAVRRVCGGDGVEEDAVVDLLDRLVERSLVATVADGSRRMRYGMLETIRHYAADRLAECGEEAAVRRRHAEHYAGVAEAFERDVSERWSERMLEIGAGAWDEVRAAALWSMRVDGARDRALRLIVPLWGLSHSRHATEIADLCEEALAAWPWRPDALGQRLLGAAAVASYTSGRPGAAEAHACRAVAAETAGAPPAPMAHRALALLAYGFRGDVQEGLRQLDASIAVMEAAGEMPALALEQRALRAQAIAASGRLDAAIAEARAVRAQADASGMLAMRAWCLYILGTVLHAADRDAEACLGEALALARRAEFHLVIGSSLRQLGSVALARGRREEAGTRFAAAYEHFGETGDRSQQWDVLRAAAHLLAETDVRAAAEILAAAESDPRARRPAPLEAPRLAALAERVGAVDAPRPLEALGPAVLDALRRTPAAPPPADAAPDAAGAPSGSRAPGLAAPPAATTAALSDSPAVFRREGELWLLVYAGRTARVADRRGLADIARLLAAPGEPVHALELAGAPVSAGGAERPEGLGVQGHAGELLDEQARREYRRRMEDLREEAERAAAAGDDERAERARAELEALTEALSSAFGLGGRPRRAGDPAERARSAVTWRIRSAVAKVQDAHPELGRHLRAAIRTGTFCRYEPEHPQRWRT